MTSTKHYSPTVKIIHSLHNALCIDVNLGQVAEEALCIQPSALDRAFCCVTSVHE